MRPCPACGVYEQIDSYGMREWMCDCDTCRACGTRFLEDDDEGPATARTDELACRFGDGRCARCWGRVLDSLSPEERVTLRVDE